MSCQIPKKIVAGRANVYALLPNGSITGWGSFGGERLPCQCIFI